MQRKDKKVCRRMYYLLKSATSVNEEMASPVNGSPKENMCNYFATVY